MITIRQEDPRDIKTIETVIQSAFKDHPHSDGTEHKIVSSLRENAALSLSLVAEIEGKLVGHIAFSRVEIEDGTKDWFGLGPVSVLPEFQGKGAGYEMIRRGLRGIQELGALGCVVLGEPEYYEKFGFKANSQLTFSGAPEEYFMALTFGGNQPAGEVHYNPAFFIK